MGKGVYAYVTGMSQVAELESKLQSLIFSGAVDHMVHTNLRLLPENNGILYMAS